MIDKSDFSEELFFQLSVLSIDIPSLSKRSSDIEELVEFFLRRISSENNRSTPMLVRQAYEKILGYDWPGNIRELENIIRRAVTLSNSDEINAYDIIIPKLMISEDDNTAVDEKVKGLLNEGQRTLILKTLNENNWNFTRSARKLGIGRTTLWRKVKKYNLKYENA